MDRLEGKVAAITGGASGIGAGTVRRFVEEGAKVLIADLDEAKGAALAVELGSATAFLRTDVSKEADVAAMVAETTDRFGRIDVLFNNAGFGGALGPIESTTVADYDLTMDVLLKSVFLGIKHVTPLMKATGYGQGYRYVHDHPAARGTMACLPESLRGRDYFKPQPDGPEGS